MVRLVNSGIFMHAIVTSSWYGIATRRIDLKCSHSTKKKKKDRYVNEVIDMPISMTNHFTQHTKINASDWVSH